MVNPPYIKVVLTALEFNFNIIHLYKNFFDLLSFWINIKKYFLSKILFNFTLI